MVTIKYDNVLYDIITDKVIKSKNGLDTYSLKIVNTTGDDEGKLTFIGFVDGQSEDLQVTDRNEKHAYFKASTTTQFILVINRSELQKAINRQVSFKDLKYKINFKGFEASNFELNKLEEGCEYTTGNQILDAYESYTLNVLEQPNTDINETYLNEFYVELKRH